MASITPAQGMSYEGQQLEFDDMDSSAHDTSGLVRDLYTLPEECTADFSDVSRLLYEGKSKGDVRSPRQVRRSLSRSRLQCRSPHGAASPNFTSKSGSGTVSSALCSVGCCLCRNPECPCQVVPQHVLRGT